MHKQLNIKDRQNQSRFYRYARWAMSQPFPWLAMLAMAERHAPKGLKQWTADQINLAYVQMEAAQ